MRGRTATLSQGRVTQVGPTADLYRQPANLDAAQVFSDPPLNELAAEKAGASVILGNGRRLAAETVLPGLPDGAYRIGFRSDAVSVGGAEHGLPTFPGVVAVTEINGSESFVHVDTGLGIWVCLVEGIHEWEPGQTVDVQLDLRRAFVFSTTGERIQPALRAPGVSRAATA